VEYSIVIIIINNIVIVVVYSMCERRLVALVVCLGVNTPGRGGYWPEYDMYVQGSVLWGFGEAWCSTC
jgi:hypothetical protein